MTRTPEDRWSLDGPRITDPEILSKIRATLESESPVVVEHRFYRGSSAPNRLFFDSFEDFERYLKNEVRAGDSIWIWNYSTVCTDASVLIQGKKPDAHGAVPVGGAY